MCYNQFIKLFKKFKLLEILKQTLHFIYLKGFYLNGCNIIINFTPNLNEY